MRKLCTLTLLLILGFTVVSISEIGLVKAEDTIYISADGTVEGTDVIQRDGDVYTITADAVVDGDIVVQRSNIVIDGNGHMLQNARLVISDLTNITVENMYIKDNYYGTHGINVYLSGIDVKNSSSVTITNNTVTGTTFLSNEAGIRIVGGNSNVIVGNTLSHNQKGLTISNTIDFETFIPIDVMVYNNNFYNDFDVEFSIMSGSQIPSSTISFDNGTRGNFWYKYNGTDVNSDGIGDTPYVISTSPYYTDNNPLMEPYGNPIVEVPEFPSWIVVLLTGGAVLIMAVVFRRRLHKRNQMGDNQ
jgi:parallel beta-helix repeat protein